jgi:hypothetical protein
MLTELAAPAAADPEIGPDPGETKIWATKGLAFWALLSAILVKTRPESLLELGSGRSTTFLADYAFRWRKPLVSVEQSEVWWRKAVADLRFMHVRGEHVHHVPVVKPRGEPPWYHLETMRRLLDGRRFDFVFVDGPQGGARRSPSGQAMVLEATEAARLIIVDDVHRPYNLELFEQLAERMPPEGRFFYRYGDNVLAIAADEHRTVVEACFRFLELDYDTTAPAGGSDDDA